jgi:regulatory protein
VEGSPPERADRLERALGLAYRYVDRRERTVSEVRRHLQAQELEHATVEETLGELVALGALDDARFARVFAEDKRELEQWGADRIRRGLASRGVDRDLIEATLGDETADTELDRAVAVLRRRFHAPPGDRRERERALGVLLRKGYDSETSLDAIRGCAQAWAES